MPDERVFNGPDGSETPIEGEDILVENQRIVLRLDCRHSGTSSPCGEGQ